MNEKQLSDLSAVVGEELPLDRDVAAIAPTIVPEGDTDEHRAIHAGGRDAERLLRDPKLVAVMSAMTALRRAYAVAYRELRDRLDAEPEGTVHPMTADVIVGAAMHQAAKPFSEHALMKSLFESTFPWMADVIDRHTAADEAADRVARAEAEARRRALAIPLGFDPHLVPAGLRGDDHDPEALPRDRALVLIGYAPVLDWLLRRTLALAADAGLRTLLLARHARPEDQRVGILRLAGNVWAGCCNTKDSLPVLIGRHAAPVFPRLDLVVCADLVRAYTRSFTGRAPGATAGDAHRRLAQAAAHLGAGLIGLIPQAEPEDVDVRTPEFAQLQTFAHLRWVQATDRGEAYRVRVGGLDAIVPKAELEAAPLIVAP